VPHGAGRAHTLSICVPGSVCAQAQSLELATKVAGQIARAAAIFRVDEIIVLDVQDGARPKVSEIRSGADFLARVLQYLETPQYLRRVLIPVHKDLRFAGMLPPLDAPHQPRQHEWLEYREGAVVEDVATPGAETSTLANVGLDRDVRMDYSVPKGMRVTVAMGPSAPAADTGEPYEGSLVSPSAPRERAGLYWGYSIRIARGLSSVFTECPFEEGYDVTVGTSEHGSAEEPSLPAFKHALVAFGGIEGLEQAAESDAALEVKDPACLFDHYLNTCANQGSRTIRTEEAVLISLCALQEPLRKAHGKA